MDLIPHNGLPLLQFELFTRFPGIIHAVTTRCGGCSSGPYESLNMGFQVGDVHQHVLGNRQTVLTALGYNDDVLVMARQVHKTRVTVVRGLSGENRGVLPEVDGFITATPGLLLMIKIADCFPVFLYDPERRIIGLLHAGWRGAASGIIENGLEVMASTFGVNPKNLVAGVGPGINKCCFEVGQEVLDGFSANPWFTDALWERLDRDTYLFDLKHAIVLRLKSCGLTESAIAVAGQCTSCCRDLLFSHRRDKGKTGRMAAVLGLKTPR